jgi:hypothetical protein
MCDKAQLNKNAENTYYADTASPVTNAGMGYRVTVRERFLKQLHDSQAKKQQADRVLDIFNRHPEFEELVELLELLNNNKY